MKHELVQHKFAYLTLVLGLVVFILSFFGVWPDRSAQRLIILGLVCFYTIWGIVTHLKADHITKHVIYEYLGVAGFAGVLLWLVTL